MRVAVARGEHAAHATLQARGQANAAAGGAAGVAHALLEGEIGTPGAWMPEQGIDPGRFFSRLAREGLRVELVRGPA